MSPLFLVQTESLRKVCYLRTGADLFDSAQYQSYASAAKYVQTWDQHSDRHSVHLRPSPGVMLTSCLVLGCCISSFLYRHHGADAYQAPVFASALVGSVVVGHMAGASVYMVLLGYMPWALCTAMFLSTLGHAMLRWARPKGTAETVMDDKIALLP